MAPTAGVQQLRPAEADAGAPSRPLRGKATKTTTLDGGGGLGLLSGALGAFGDMMKGPLGR